MFRKISFAFISVMLLSLIPRISHSQFALQSFVSSPTRITDLSNCGDDRLFITQQPGKVLISDLNGILNQQPFLSITARVNDTGNEQGLLGFAFSPNYITDKRFYVNYINNAGNTVIARYHCSTTNPDVADSLNEEILFTVLQPYPNHNGGCMQFGPDGYLYISLGDGGAGGDPQDNGQDLQTRLGKILRIDVSADSGYAIPPSNPFVGVANTDSTIWAYGLRNAWRMSFDKLNGDLWIADVGQTLWEEVNYQPASSSGGENYGWRCYEGFADYNLLGCQPPSFYIQPVHVMPHPPACSVTGGYVYRGGKYASWFGKYFFTDLCASVIQSLAPNDTGGFDLESYGTYSNYNFSTFGQDRYGELYVARISSGVYKLTDTTSCMPVAFISELDTIFHNSTSLTLQTPYSPGLTYQWFFNGSLINGATSNKFKAVVSGNYMVQVANENSCVNNSQPVTVILKSNENILIFPNPAGDVAQISWSNNFPGDKTLQLFDASGKKCLDVTFDKYDLSYELNTARFAKGIYVVRIIYNDTTYHKKFMIR